MAYRAGDIVIVICHRIGTGYPGLAAFAYILCFSNYIDSYFKLLEMVYSTIKALAFWLLFSTSRLRIDYFRIDFSLKSLVARKVGKAETSTAAHPYPAGSSPRQLPAAA
jgi:hypothetical protein